MIADKIRTRLAHPTSSPPFLFLAVLSLGPPQYDNTVLFRLDKVHLLYHAAANQITVQICDDKVHLLYDAAANQITGTSKALQNR